MQRCDRTADSLLRPKPQISEPAIIQTTARNINSESEEMQSFFNPVLKAVYQNQNLFSENILEVLIY